MKLKIKLDFWECEDADIWRDRYSKMAWMCGVFNGISILVFITIRLYIMAVILAMPVIIGVVALISLNKWNERRRKLKDGREEADTKGN